ncbi:RecQ-mediated genome instability protein 2 [Dillenia turbinata]|uniref:RecQ-mediated genome instability protein 2 n=1 Tax=Dillenia turbinata TaxID=194707 RepID=A0AAN8V399_9MAGN
MDYSLAALKLLCQQLKTAKETSDVCNGDRSVHKMVDLSAFPDREAMWYLEVIEAHQLFYTEKDEDEEGTK